jgi:hypothetical protein
VSEPPNETAGAGRSLHVSVYRDAEGNRTQDPGKAVGGEILERPAEDRAPRRTWFLVREVELKWLPVSEAAFLLWVLALLLFAWFVTALVVLVF